MAIVWRCCECGSDDVEGLIPTWCDMNGGGGSEGDSLDPIDFYCHGCGHDYAEPKEEDER